VSDHRQRRAGKPVMIVDIPGGTLADEERARGFER